MNILLTGGAGYIGSHTAATLLDAGHQVIIFDNLSNSAESVVTRLHLICSKAPVFIKGDVRDEEAIRDCLEKYRIEAVIHFAGLKSVAESALDPLRYFDNNVSGSISLLNAMSLVGVKKIVFSSSATVYGQPQYLPYDEVHPTGPINTYGRTKLQVEEILKNLSESDQQWHVVILRYFNPVGAHESGLIGEEPDGVPNNLMPYLAQVATGKLPCLNIYGDDYQTVDGTGARDYIHVVDLAEGHLAALDYLNTHAGFEIINLGTGISTTVLELLTAFEKVIGMPIPKKIAPRRAGDLPIYFAQAYKAKHLLSWVAKKDIHEMCESTWKWQKFRSMLNE